jgi:hypothetical protein
MNKIITIILVTVISVNVISAQSIKQEVEQQRLQGKQRQQNTDIELEKQKFKNKMLPFITLTDSLMKEEYAVNSVRIGQVILGDLNGDGVNDAIISYSGDAGTLASAFSGNWVYIMNQGEPNLITADFGTGVFGYMFPYPLTVSKIENGIVFCTSYKYISEDPRCCPSINILSTYKLVGNEMVQLSEKYFSEKTGTEIEAANQKNDGYLKNMPTYDKLSSPHGYLYYLTLKFLEKQYDNNDDD